jgi:hypothetical protein
MTTLVSPKTNNLKETEESVHNINGIHQLFKPLVINQRLVRRTESDITTMTNASLPLSVNNLSKDSNIPIIYPQFQLGSLSGLKASPQMHPFIYQENQNKKVLDIKNKPCCSCNKTKCIKKYCECFANNKSCTNCLCLDCRNKDIFLPGTEGALSSENKNKNKGKEIVVCTCSKSGCNKKYCECYKEGQKCNIKCRCINCLNMEEPLDKSVNDSNKVISVEETKSESGKKTKSKNDTDCFNVQRISIFINKSQTLINVEKLDKEEFNLLCKKRKKSLN